MGNPQDPTSSKGTEPKITVPDPDFDYTNFIAVVDDIHAYVSVFDYRDRMDLPPWEFGWKTLEDAITQYVEDVKEEECPEFSFSVEQLAGVYRVEFGDPFV